MRGWRRSHPRMPYRSNMGFTNGDTVTAWAPQRNSMQFHPSGLGRFFVVGEPVLLCVYQQVDTVNEIKLLINITEVVVHGVLADTQAPGDAHVFGRRIPHDGANQFLFTQRQPRLFRLLRIAFQRYMPGRGIVGKPTDPGSIQPDVAMVDLDDGSDDRFRRVFRQHDAACARLYRLGNRDGFVQALEHQDFHFGAAGEPRDDRQWVQRIRKETEKNDIGTQLIGKIQRFGIGGGLPAHFHLRLAGIDQVLKAHKNKRTTVDQHHAYWFYLGRHYRPDSLEK